MLIYGGRASGLEYELVFLDTKKKPRQNVPNDGQLLSNTEVNTI